MTINPQNNNYNKEVNSFSDSVKKYLKIKKMTQADLIRKSMLTRTTVSRICRNSNDKGSTYQPTDRIVMSVCVALGLDSKETKELFSLAFPYLKCWDKIIAEKMNIDQANSFLYDEGLPLLGSPIDEYNLYAVLLFAGRSFFVSPGKQNAPVKSDTMQSG